MVHKRDIITKQLENGLFSGIPTEEQLMSFLGVGSDDKVFIEATDHTLYDSSNWSLSGKTANSIVVMSRKIKFRMALVSENKNWDPSPSAPVERYMYGIRYDTIALMDIDGAGNTDKLISFHIAQGTNNNNFAAPYCRNYVFPDGTRNCYLPALGQLLFVYKNHKQISACLSACGGKAIDAGSPYVDMNSSTFTGIGATMSNDTHRRFWNMNAITGNLDEYSVIAGGIARPFADYD